MDSRIQSEAGVDGRVLRVTRGVQKNPVGRPGDKGLPAHRGGPGSVGPWDPKRSEGWVRTKKTHESWVRGRPFVDPKKALSRVREGRGEDVSLRGGGSRAGHTRGTGDG